MIASKNQFIFKGVLWKWYADTGAWHFITLPVQITQKITVITQKKKRKGFGSLRVQVTIGCTTFLTSIFPHSQSKSFLLPIKQSVRRKEELEEGDAARVQLTLV